MTVFKLLSLIGICSLLLYFSCSSAKELSITIPEEGAFFDYISDYGIFQVKQGQIIPHTDLVKYEVINALFTDYAEKDRYVYMPTDQKATLKEDGFFTWPTGTIIVKNFAYTEEQLESSRLLETRLLIKDSDAWKAISYIWDEAQKTAKISKVGDVFPLNIQHETKQLSFDYVVPNKNQCKSCHNKGEKIDPLGLKFANLNRNVSRDGEIKNQIDYLVTKKVIEINPYAQDINTMVAYTDVEAPIQERALAYLDVNCGHCHRPDGPGNTSGLFLQYDEKRSNHLGLCKGPVAAGKGTGGRSYDINPGSATSSILHYRMNSKDPGIMMPEIGRSLIHDEGIAIIEAWINSIEFDCETQKAI